MLSEMQALLSEGAPGMVRVLVESFVAQALGYFAVVGLVFVVVWWWGRERFRAARIPAPAKFDRAQLRREIWNTLGAFVAGTASLAIVLALQVSGHTSLTTESVPAGVVLAWTTGFLLFNDAWFYAWHRLLHHPRLFRHVHAVHHKSVDVNPFTSYSFHMLEALILGAWIVPVAVFLPLPMAALGLLQGIGLANNVMSHLGYEFLPRWLVRVPILRWTNTATFHSLHHTNLKGNFGLHTRLWDRLFGTEVADYEQVFVTRGGSRENPNEPAPAR